MLTGQNCLAERVARVYRGLTTGFMSCITRVTPAPDTDEGAGMQAIELWTRTACLSGRARKCGPQSECVFPSASVDLDDGARDK
jgi:hypothetical protein